MIDTLNIPELWRRRLYLPAYTIAEAAQLAQTAPQTVTYWYYRRPVFTVPKERRRPLSYLGLAEIAFVASFRKCGVTLSRIRNAREYLSKVFRTDYPFALLRLKTDGVHILKDFEEQEDGRQPRLLVADQFGQEAWPQLIAERIAQFDYEKELAIRWFPRGKNIPITIDPRIAFGAPIVTSVGVATWVLKERYLAGESIKELERDFGIIPGDIRIALQFEGIQIEAR